MSAGLILRDPIRSELISTLPRFEEPGSVPSLRKLNGGPSLFLDVCLACIARRAHLSRCFHHAPSRSQPILCSAVCSIWRSHLGYELRSAGARRGPVLALLPNC